MTATALLCFAALVLVASLRAFGPGRPLVDARRRRARRPGPDLLLAGPLPTLDLLRGDRRAGSPIRLTGPGDGRPRGGRIGD